jgi:hypothetical protein
VPLVVPSPTSREFLEKSFTYCAHGNDAQELLMGYMAWNAEWNAKADSDYKECRQRMADAIAQYKAKYPDRPEPTEEDFKLKSVD